MSLEDQGIVLIMAMLAFALAAYFLPTITALLRGHTYKWIIFIVNLTLGWTFLVWVGAFVWAIWPKEKSLIVGDTDNRLEF